MYRQKARGSKAGGSGSGVSNAGGSNSGGSEAPRTKNKSTTGWGIVVSHVEQFCKNVEKDSCNFLSELEKREQFSVEDGTLSGLEFATLRDFFDLVSYSGGDNKTIKQARYLVLNHPADPKRFRKDLRQYCRSAADVVTAAGDSKLTDDFRNFCTRLLGGSVTGITYPMGFKATTEDLKELENKLTASR